MTYLSIYFAGILSFFSPCILPIIPVYFSILKGTGKLRHKALMFCLGFCLIFALMGGGAGLIGSFIQTNKSLVNLIAGIIILLLGLKFLNVIQIPKLDRSYSIDTKKFKTRFELLNAFIIGLLFAVTWSPCIGAILGGILTYITATGSSAASSTIKLFIYGVGISTPLIISVFFYEKIARFYKGSPYFFDMVTKLLGFILILFALSLFSNVVKSSKIVSKGLSNADKVMVCEKLPVFISFISDSCEDCQTMKPIVEQLNKSCGNKTVEFRTVDLDDQQYEYLAYQQGIFGTPTYILLDDKGKEKQRLYGVQKLEDMDTAIKNLAGKKCIN